MTISPTYSTLAADLNCNLLAHSPIPDPLEPQINAILVRCMHVTNLGLQLDDKLIAFAIMSSLASPLSTLKTILSTTRSSESTTEYVKSQIILSTNSDAGAIPASGQLPTLPGAAKKGKGKGDQSESDKPRK
jgi:hypothetical protein